MLCLARADASFRGLFFLMLYLLGPVLSLARIKAVEQHDKVACAEM